MKLNINNTKNKIVRIKDAMGRHIPHAFSYNTKTKKIGLYLYAKVGKTSSVVTANKNGRGYVVRVSVVVPGSYAEINGKKIK